MQNDIVEILAEVNDEVSAAIAVYPPMHSVHEGYAIILEELDELWEEVRPKPSKRSTERLKKEAIQVAAMAIRFIHDLT